MMYLKHLAAVYFFVKKCSNSTLETNSDLEKLETIQINVPGYPNSIVNFCYYDSSAKKSEKEKRAQAVILATHGSPASHKDFKYMVPRLIASGYRVIIPNWPGLGVTVNLPPAEFNHSNIQRAQLLQSFVKKLNFEKINVAVGHSSGCYPYPPFFCDNPGLCEAAIFITPAGASPQRNMRPYWLTGYIVRLLDTPLKSVVSYVVYMISTQIYGIRVTHPDHANVMTRIVANLDFAYLNATIEELKKKKNPPIILICGKEDRIVEKEKSIEYAEKLGCTEYNGVFHVESGEEIDGVIKQMLSSSSRGRLDRHYAILFERESHFLQKHEAESICKIIDHLIKSNKNSLT